ncbi:MAG TPA: FAD-dependent oxidoreductase, partial [Clostridia bacterium]|nr:FAD-dependent oxidoreductase [Clostridia bacterium]
MDPFIITIDGAEATVTPGQSVLAVARSLGLDIPSLCYLEKCGPLNSCQACLVKINGRLVPSCGTLATPGMVVESETEEIHEARRTALELLFSDHVGDCLSPCNRLCPLGLNIPVMLRQIQGGKMEEASAGMRGVLPLAGVLGRLCHHPCEQGCRRGHWDDPAGIRDLERFVADWEMHRANAIAGSPAGQGRESTLPVTHCKPGSGKTVAVIGAGPAGLAAAWQLARYGHTVTVVDRQDQPGGSLRALPESELPAAVLDFEMRVLAHMGIVFKQGVELGNHVTIEGLARGFDAILLSTGRPHQNDSQPEAPLSGGYIKTDPNTSRTPLAKVFAAGAAAKAVPQLVRAMGDGRAAAECIHRFVLGQAARRPEKPFSSVMGRLSPGELKQFLALSNQAKSVSPCDRCTGLSRPQATSEAARCLHCDCASSGNCVLQHYAQRYDADASRFRPQRRSFEQHLQPGGVIFEPGKCILCGI